MGQNKLENRLNNHVLKIHGFKERKMNFFNHTTIPISSHDWESWAYHCDDSNIPEPFHQLYYPYSIHHNQLPKSVVPNSASSDWDTLVANDGSCGLSISSPSYLYSETEDILYEYAHAPCLQLLSKSLHFLSYMFELSNRGNVFVHRLTKHDNGIWLSKLYEHLIDLYYVNYSYIPTWSKDKKFIETKVAAINCRVLTINQKIKFILNNTKNKINYFLFFNLICQY